MLIDPSIKFAWITIYTHRIQGTVLKYYVFSTTIQAKKPNDITLEISFFLIQYYSTDNIPFDLFDWIVAENLSYILNYPISSLVQRGQKSYN